ncbi:hypothetical protein FOZ60_010002 [Perkinsus olseni]|uniref:Uncharacterized protein n=1 Tax=Perkinsus olseni TaxID=32597 RepID=A0A7J6PCF6_PEROL|nr:hypothetical protein FOZ60_010002 [Perkinsus olseni]
MSSSTVVLLLVTAAVLPNLDGFVPENPAFKTTYGDGVCFMVYWHSHGPIVSYYAKCPSWSPGVTVSAKLNLTEGPMNTFALTADETNRKNYESFIKEARESCQKSPKLEIGDTEKITHKLGPKGETLEASIGLIKRIFSPGFCPT